MNIKGLIKKIVPKWVIGAYHWALAWAGAIVYGFPSRKIKVIGITGTKGKSTTSYLVAKLLEAVGERSGLSSTIIYKVGKREWLNNKKMTMPGRFGLQKLLRQMVLAGCKYAVIETSSEGIAQFRHKGIKYDIGVFTNLSPEHIESHGGYEKYKRAKAELFCAAKECILNVDDKEADYFLKFCKTASGFSMKKLTAQRALPLKSIVFAENIKIKKDGTEFEVLGVNFKTQLLGEFNVYNILTALSILNTLGFELKKFKKAVLEIKNIPGRMEFIDDGQDFKVIIDYAHEPASLEALFKVVGALGGQRIIHIFGATGGGRDKARRKIMGEISEKNADIIILTDDDPYEEDREKIIKDIKKGIKRKKPIEELDREKAIKKGVELACKDDIVLITGKGCEQKMAVGNRMIPWDDRQVVRNILNVK